MKNMVQVFSEGVSIPWGQTLEEYTTQANELLSRAKEKGWVSCELIHEAVSDSDGYTTVELSVSGWRDETGDERKQREQFEFASEISRELNYDPCITEVDKLLTRGKTKDEILQFYKPTKKDG